MFHCVSRRMRKLWHVPGLLLPPTIVAVVPLLLSVVGTNTCGCNAFSERPWRQRLAVLQDWWTANMARGSLVNELLDPFWMCCPVLTDLHSIYIYIYTHMMLLTSYPSWLIHSLSCAGEWYFLQPERTVSFLRSDWALKAETDNKFCTLLNHYPTKKNN